MLRMIGASVDDPKGTVTFNNIAGLHFWPRVTWSPLFDCTFDDLEAKINAKHVHIGQDTVLVISAPDAKIESLDLKRGALVIDAPSGEAVVVKDEVVENEGWEWTPLDPDSGALEEEYIRGFKVVKKETKEIK